MQAIVKGKLRTIKYQNRNSKNVFYSSYFFQKKYHFQSATFF